jgi:hypothetical protein
MAFQVLADGEAQKDFPGVTDAMEYGRTLADRGASPVDVLDLGAKPNTVKRWRWTSNGFVAIEFEGREKC